VVVVGFDMSLSNMVEFMIKLGIASIPAALILAVLYAVAWTFLTSLAG
jgi:accessory gene regulator protein AgrB